MRVTFRPSLDEHLDFVTVKQREHKAKVTNFLSWILFAFNLAFVPACLIYFDHTFLAISCFLFNLLLFVGLYSWQRDELRQYYRRVWPELEAFDCEIGISEQGVSCDHAGNKSFYPWCNVRSVRSLENQVFFEVGGLNVILSKRAFANQQAEKDFIELATKYKKAAETVAE